jgi:hypothetical protein
VKNGSFDLAFRTMTIGLLMFMVLSIVSIGIHNLRPGSGSQFGPLAETQSPPVAAESARVDEIRREFTSSLVQVSDRLAGIEQRFSTLAPPQPTGAPTVEDARLQSAIESTQRRLEHLGDRLTDRIQSISAGSEVELRDLNRQLSHLLDEQQQIQEQMVSVRVAAENRLRPARMTRTRDELNSDVPKSRTAENRQDRLTQNLEAMVGELASLREQLQSVRIAAANIEPRDERVAISRKIPQDVATSGVSPEAEAPLDRTVPDPPDLDLLLDPSAVDSTAVPSTQKENSSESVGRPSTPAVPAIDQPQAPATGTDLLEDSIELPSAGLPQTSAVPVQPLPVQPLPVQSPPVQSLPPDVVASQSLPSQATPAQPARVAVAGDEPDNADRSAQFSRRTSAPGCRLSRLAKHHFPMASVRRRRPPFLSTRLKTSP